MQIPDDHRFDASGPIGQYWLVNGLDFTVCRADGRRLGVVDPVQQHARQIVVRRAGVGRRRRSSLDPALIEAVVPSARLFLVPPPPRRAHGRRLAAGGRRLRRAGAAAALLVAAGLSAGARGVARVVRVVASELGEIAVAVAGALVELAVLAGALAATVWRRAAAELAQARARSERSRLEADAADPDADAPLGRDANHGVPEAGPATSSPLSTRRR